MIENGLDYARDLLLKNNEAFLANALLIKSIQRDTHNFDLVEKLGSDYLKQGSYEQARSCFSALRAHRPSFDNYFYYSNACEMSGNLEEAKQSYLDALLISTSNINLLFEAYKNLGNIYLREQNLDIAEDFYHKAFALNSQSPQLLVNLGTLELQKRDLSRAIERFRNALSINPRFSPGWTGLALTYQDFGDFDLAWASVLKATDCDPKNTTALLLLAQWSTKRNSQDLAMNHLMEYFDLGEFNVNLSIAFIELCLQKGINHLAIIELERALLWEPKNTQLQVVERTLREHGIN